MIILNIFLKKSFSFELDCNVEAVNASLNDFLKLEERKCARFMTTMRPFFHRARCPLPEPPKYIKLSSTNAMGDAEGSIGHMSPEVISEMIIKSTNSLDWSVHCAALYQLMRDLSASEARNRVRRKSLEVTARVEAIEEYKKHMLRTLSQRRVVTPPDIAVQRSLMDKFRVAQAEEGVLMDFKGSYNDLKGLFFITITHIYFHSQSLLGGDVRQHVIPLRAVSAVGPMQSDEYVSPGYMAKSIVSDYIRLMDHGGSSHVLLVSGPTKDYAIRVCDVIKYLVEMITSSSSAASEDLPRRAYGTGVRGVASVEMIERRVCEVADSVLSSRLHGPLSSIDNTRSTSKSNRVVAIQVCIMLVELTCACITIYSYLNIRTSYIRNSCRVLRRFHRLLVRKLPRRFLWTKHQSMDIVYDSRCSRNSSSHGNVYISSDVQSIICDMPRQIVKTVRSY